MGAGKFFEGWQKIALGEQGGAECGVRGGDLRSELCGPSELAASGGQVSSVGGGRACDHRGFCRG